MNLTLIQTIDTSAFSPSSPDPAGITFLNFSNTLLISDSEVNEQPFFGTENLFEISLAGNLVGTSSTLDFSLEPTGVAYNPANQNLFISNDDAEEIVEFDLANDSVINIIDTTTFGSFDPEGVAFASNLGTLFVADGLNSEVYQISTDGTLISSFDTASLGVSDPEGIEYDPSSGNLYIVGEPASTVLEVTTSGTVVNTLDISAANPVVPAGLALAPSSQNSSETSLYIVDRGIDNNADPNENDGKVYEFSLEITPPGNQAPIVNAGDDQTITDFSVFLDATVTDDGLPNPPAGLTFNWSQVSGPGTATFSNANAEDTTVTLPDGVFGEYVFSLDANDSELSTSDEITVTVTEPTEPTAFSTILVSSTSDGTVGGVSFADEDILAFDTASQTWSTYFDGSDVGLDASDADINAFYLNADGSILLSLNKTFTLPDVGIIDDNDIVRFVPTSTGSNTAGTYEFYLDGSDVELSGGSEDIDGISLLSDGRLAISTKGSANVSGISTKDEDLLVFNATSLGESTSGTWSLYADNSDVGLGDNGGEDISATWVDGNGDIYLSTDGAFNVVGLSGDSSDIFSFTPSSLGDNTSGTFNSFWDGSQNGFGGQNIDGLSLV